jgi:hypothetical protein
MSHGLKPLAPSKSNPSNNDWTEEEEATFSDIIERLKHVRDTHTQEDFVVNVRRAVLHALKNFGARRTPMIPILQRSNPINRILGKCRHLLLGPKRIA